MDHFGPIQPVVRFCQGVVVAVAIAAHRGLIVIVCESFAVADGSVLQPPIGMMSQFAIALERSGSDTVLKVKLIAKKVASKAECDSSTSMVRCGLVLRRRQWIPPTRAENQVASR